MTQRTIQLLLLFVALIGVTCELSAKIEQLAFTNDKEAVKHTTRWSTDPFSPPLCFRDPMQFDNIIGAEAEIRLELIKILDGENILLVNDYENLVPGVRSNFYDVIYGGVELTRPRMEEVVFTQPHLVTHGQLFVAKGSSITGVHDLMGKRVGVIRTTPLHQYLKMVEGISVITYSHEMLAFRDLAYHRLDAVLADAPYGQYYTYNTPDIIPVGGPVGKVEYSFALNLESVALRNRIDNALNQLRTNGKLREIAIRWDLWNPDQARDMGLPYVAAPKEEQGASFRKYAAFALFDSPWKERLRMYKSIMPDLGKAALMTLWVAVGAMLFAMMLGFALALGKQYGPQLLRWFISFYIEFFRGTPLLIQLLIIFYGLPLIGITLPPMVAGIVGLGLNYAAYQAEIYRAGLLSVPDGQMEAARALGMSHAEGLRYVIIPQAIRIVIPPMTNDFISLLKDSSLVSMITIIELTFVYSQVASTYFDFLGTGIIVAFIYLLIGVPFVILSRFTERRMARVFIR